MILTERDLARFDCKWEVNSATGCHEWTASLAQGYGQFWLHGTQVKAHRVSMVRSGAVLGDFDVCHRCDNRRCVNLEHLFLGTHQDNVDDKMQKGRWHGGRRPFLTKEQDSAVRQLRAATGWGQDRIGAALGLHPNPIRSVIHRETTRGL